ncbi:MAG: hypothetical protein AAF648_12050 [Pseudomonadota bacterium]
MSATDSTPKHSWPSLQTNTPAGPDREGDRWPVLQPASGDSQLDGALPPERAEPGEDTRPAAAVLPEERRAAREQGYAEGLRLGREAAQAERDAERLALADSVETLQIALTSLKRTAAQRLESVLVELTHALCLTELERCTSWVDQLLDRAMDEAGFGEDELTLRAGSAHADLLDSLRDRGGLKVEIDDGLESGQLELSSGDRLAQFDCARVVAQLLASKGALTEGVDFEQPGVAEAHEDTEVRS